MLEELARVSEVYFFSPDIPPSGDVLSALSAINRDNERVDRLQKDYDAAVEKLEAEPNGGWGTSDK